LKQLLAKTPIFLKNTLFRFIPNLYIQSFSPYHPWLRAT